MEQNYTRELSRATTGTFQLNIPSQRYLRKRPYARPRNGRAINYITAYFRKYVKVDLHAPARINRAVADAYSEETTTRAVRARGPRVPGPGSSLYSYTFNYIGRNHQSISSFREAPGSSLSPVYVFALCHAAAVVTARFAIDLSRAVPR